MGFILEDTMTSEIETKLPDFDSLKIGETFIFAKSESLQPKLKLSTQKYLDLNTGFSANIVDELGVTEPLLTEVRRCDIIVEEIIIKD